MSKRSVFVLVCALFATQLAAADVLHTRTAKFEGRILRIDKQNVIIRVGSADLTVALGEVLREEIAPPAAYKEGLELLRDGKHQEAIGKLRPIVDQYGGLRSPWIPDAMMRLGDAYLAAEDLKSAEKTFAAFKDYYARSPEAAQLMDIKFAHVTAGQKKHAAALEQIKPAKELLLKKDYLSAQEELLLSEAFLLVGDCQLAQGKKDAALEAYLNLVALYDIDPARTAEALYKSGKVFEQLGNWRRARDCYQDLLAESPNAACAPDAQKRLDAIAQAHPE